MNSQSQSQSDSQSGISFGPDRNENALLSILFNIVLPVFLLNKLTEPMTQQFGEHGPAMTLIVALAFPALYGVQDYLRRRKKNAISLLGFLNILLTGGLALLQLKGIWFAVKEAAFPLLIGIFVFLSTNKEKPFIQLFVYNENLLNLQLIEQKLAEHNKSAQIMIHLRRSTMFLAGSFLLSAILNFALARYIFVPIDQALSSTDYAAILNTQIAQMTWLSWFVIMIPSMICLAAILWHLFSGIQKLTGLSLTEIVRSH